MYLRIVVSSAQIHSAGVIGWGPMGRGSNPTSPTSRSQLNPGSRPARFASADKGGGHGMVTKGPAACQTFDLRSAPWPDRRRWGRRCSDDDRRPPQRIIPAQAMPTAHPNPNRCHVGVPRHYGIQVARLASAIGHHWLLSGRGGRMDDVWRQRWPELSVRPWRAILAHRHPEWEPWEDDDYLLPPEELLNACRTVWGNSRTRQSPPRSPRRAS